MSISFEELRLQRFDPAALLNVINSTMMEQRILGGGALDVHCRRLVLEDLTINTGDYSFPVLAKGVIPDGQAHIGLMRTMSGDVRANDCLLSLDQLQLYAPGSELHYAARSRAEWVVLVLPFERLQAAAISQQCGELKWPREGVRCVDLPANVASCLRREIFALLRPGGSLADLADECVTESLACEGLIQLLAKAITGGTLSSRPPSTLTAGRRRALAALESCIDSWKINPANGLHFAQTRGASERMLELATREAYGATPLHWLKLARLNAAYQDLLYRNSTSVTESSQRWGFTHMGRFAMDYRALFGESPSETLLKDNN